MKIIYIITLLFFQCLAYCQPTNLDSLTQQLSEATEDSSKIIALNRIGVHYYFTKTPEDGRIYHDQALEIAQERGLKKHIGKTLYYLGYLDYVKDEHSLAIQKFERARTIYDEIEDADGIVRVYRILGKMARESEDYTKAVEYLKKAEKYIYRLPQKSARLGRITLYEVGNIYWTLHNSEAASEYYYKLLKWAEEDKDSMDIGFGLRILGRSFYHRDDTEKGLEYLRKAYAIESKFGEERSLAYGAGNLALCFLKRNELDSAQFYAIQHFQFFKSYGQKSSLAKSYELLGRILLEIENNQTGFDYLSKALELFNESNASMGKVTAQLYLGSYHHKYGSYDMAIAVLKEALPKAQKNNSFINLEEITKYLAKSYEDKGNLTQAIHFYKQQMAYKDSINSSQEAKKLENFEIQYRVKETENALLLKQTQLSFQKQALSKQQTLNGVIGFVALLILAMAILIWRNSQQRKLTNQKLRQLDRAKSRFFTNISHELRTPLTLILAPIENAIDKVKSKSVKEDLQLAHSNSKKLFTLVNEIMDLSKLESGKMQLKETAVDLEKLLRRIFFSYQSLAEVRRFDLNFTCHLPKGLGVQLDIEKFEKVLNNLLSNAFKYSEPGGAISLEVSIEKENLKIEIHDTGKGMSKANLERIFDRFYQIEGEGEPMQGGTGIGLAYAKEIALLFGGNLSVESELGKGSNFILTMPKKITVVKSQDSIGPDEILEPVYSKIETPLYPVLNGKPHLLIVEDNPEMSKFLVQTLSNQFLCTTAMDGIEALKKLENQKFDLITSDVMMPNMDGFTFLEKVHEREEFMTTPVILLTARTLEEDKLRAFQLGVDDYLTKPFNTKELIARIKNLLKNKKEREQWHLENNSVKSKEKEEEMPLSFEKQLLKTAEDIVLKNLSNSNFKVTEFARELNYSQRQVERIIKKITGLSPVGFLREIRLQKAYHMIESRQFATISEVRLEVGIENASHFSKKFQERFGRRPVDVKGKSI